MSETILALFPGQGSQKVGMGSQYMAPSANTRTEIAQEYLATADKILGFKLSQIMLNGPAEQLTETAVAQPAILTVSTIAYQIAVANDPALVPVGAAGHSLGEYSALVAAGAISFEDAVMLVHKRGRYMQEAVPKGAGNMVAVLGKELAEIEQAISKVSTGIAQVANINAPGQVVVAGDVAGVENFQGHIDGGKVIPLDVSAPFHCSLMKPAADSLAKDLDGLTIQKCKFPVYANFTGAPMREPEEIRQNLKDQVCGRVRWVELMQNAIADLKPTTAIEFGEGRVLAGLLKKINKDLPCRNL